MRRNSERVGAAGSGRRRVFVAVGCAGVVAVTGVTWALASQARSPRQLAAQAEPPPPSTITVPVRVERLARTARLECAAIPALRFPVPVATPDGYGVPIVTALPVKKGAQVREGMVVMAVSGRPVIVLRGALPAYRDLAAGAEGPDVRQVQASLVRLGLLGPAQASGTFDARTREAIVRLYRLRGYPAPGVSSAPPENGQGAGQGDEPVQDGQGDGQGDEPGASDRPSAASVTLPRSEVMIVPERATRLGQRKARVGGKAATGALVLTSGRAVVQCPVYDMSLMPHLTRGLTATVTTPNGAHVKATVQRANVTEPSRAEDAAGGQEAGTVSLRPSKTVKLGDGYRAEIVLESTDGTGPVVPSSALWSRPDGRTVVRVRRDGGEVEIAVEPGLETEGKVAVTPLDGAELLPSDEVIVTADPSGS
ncbi:hypothetical protein [Actinocorallia sp. A-T 12471]|uniref:hypothetical protein n=1 Tax=Actinocorallia sp. A-T 12471 TaxID=3089813 RepID=UPI0029CE9BAB|nr:hypothetical protein [Actinocorallia sp. A-T 12471]MDX6738310.1 hypothetical protein [Actinocorallia sp. A-T 12471]